VLAEVQVNGAWVGSRMTALESASGARVAFLTRLGEGIVPTPDTVYQEGDLVHVVMRHDQVASVEQTLAGPPAKDEA
jgi:trk system potassium uptake protein